jgi:hypothetical protein
MIRAPKLVASRPMYAFDPGTFHTGHGFDADHCGTRGLRAAWFKRKGGRLVATMGTYHLWIYHLHDTKPVVDTYDAWVAAHADNRSGANHEASWDGVALLGTGERVTPEVAARQVEFLSKMLARHPEPPTGYDGWWTFERRT